jgi:hypothetical protein
MLFREQISETLAISQPTHAWIAGQILRAWDENFDKPLLLAAEQHDIGWIDWEAAPTFDPRTGRPHLFRDIGAAIRAPMWTKGVQWALAAWGAHVALLLSRHGGIIFGRYADPGQTATDTEAARKFLEAQAPIEEEWARGLELAPAALEKETALVALADSLSLALCGGLKTPWEMEAPGRNGERLAMRLTERRGQPFDFHLSPWPFRSDVVTVEGEARALPAEGRFPDEAAMQAWLAAPKRTTFQARLTRG